MFEISIPGDAEATYELNDVCVCCLVHVQGLHQGVTNVTTHVHDTNADVGDATQLEGNEKLPQVIGSTSRYVTTHCSIRRMNGHAYILNMNH